MGISLVDEGDYFSRKNREAKLQAKCPVCGSPGGRFKCEGCGWGISNLTGKDGSPLYDGASSAPREGAAFSDVRRENDELREKVKGLLVNNRKLTELVVGLEEENMRMRRKGDLRSDYAGDRDSWEDTETMDNTRLHMLRPEVTIDDINAQLEEILRIMEKHGRINLNKGEEK